MNTLTTSNLINDKSCGNDLYKPEPQVDANSSEILAKVGLNSTPASEMCLKLASQQLLAIPNLLSSEESRKDSENVKKGIVFEPTVEEAKSCLQKTFSNSLETKPIKIEDPSNFKFSLNDFIPNEMNFDFIPIKMDSEDSNTVDEKKKLNEKENDSDSSISSVLRQSGEVKDEEMQEEGSEKTEKKEKELTAPKLFFWSEQQDERLLEGYKKYGRSWRLIAKEFFPGERTGLGCNIRFKNLQKIEKYKKIIDEIGLKVKVKRPSKGIKRKVERWTKEEETKLHKGFAKYKETRKVWKLISGEFFQGKRSAPQCAQHYLYMTSTKKNKSKAEVVEEKKTTD